MSFFSLPLYLTRWYLWVPFSILKRPLFSNRFWIFSVMRKFLQLEIATLPIELTEEELKEGAQFVIGVFPHGSWADYRVLMDGMLPRIFPNLASNIKTLAASVLFRMPVIREIGLWTGCVDARRSVAERQLEHGRSLLIVPGGEAEQIRTTFGKEIIYLSKRKGFVKLALQRGIPLVPCYVFGCSDYYHTSSCLFDARVALVKMLGVCIPLASGYMGSPCCPFPVKTTVVFGKPIKSKVQDKFFPTQEEIDTAHAKFVVSIKALFDEHKCRLGYGDRALVIL
jgi:1-acyl-sn-glycerol-3-phosphate acyltransferase